MKLKRPAIWAAIFMICGIYIRLGVSEMVFLVFFFFILYACLRFVMKKEWDGFIILLLFLAFGMVRSGNATEVSESPTGVDTYVAVVEDVMITGSGTQRLLLDMDEEISHKVLLIVPKLDEANVYAYSVGEIIEFTGELSHLSRASQPNGFDEWMYYLTKGAGYTVYPEKVNPLGMEASGVNYIFSTWKASLFSVLDFYLPTEERGIAKAILTGEKDFLSDEISGLYARSGIQHILCVSGLHIAIFSLYIFAVLQKGFKMAQKPLIVCTILISVVYLLFTGAAPSSIRAVVMGNMMLLGHFFGRKADWWNNVALAALVILGIQPLYLFHAGFQLSFASVIGIHLAQENMPEELNGKQKCIVALRSAIFASVFGYPLVAYYFCNISLIGILVNVVVLPVTGILLGCLSLLSVSGLVMPAAAPIFASGTKAILLYIKEICLIADQIPNGYVLVGSPSLETVYLAYAFLLCVCLFGKKFCNWKSATCFGLALWFSIYGNALVWKKNTVAFLDVGQGDAIVISTYDGRTILIDGGGWYGTDIGKSTGKYVVLPYLEYLGVSKLDGIFVTHMDREHIIGTLEVLDNIPTDTIYFSSYPQEDLTYWRLFQLRIAKNNVLLYTLDEGMQTDWADGSIECLYPVPEISFVDKDIDHGSLVLQYTYGESSVLFTGDITEEDEKLLLHRTENTLSVDAIQLPRHGSGSVTFLEEIDAQIGIISCGEDNIYGYPSRDVLSCMAELDMDVYRTDTMGTVVLHISSTGEIEVDCAKERETIYERIEKTVEKWRI